MGPFRIALASCPQLEPPQRTTRQANSHEKCRATRSQTETLSALRTAKNLMRPTGARHYGRLPTDQSRVASFWESDVMSFCKCCLPSFGSWSPGIRSALSYKLSIDHARRMWHISPTSSAVLQKVCAWTGEFTGNTSHQFSGSIPCNQVSARQSTPTTVGEDGALHQLLHMRCTAVEMQALARGLASNASPSPLRLGRWHRLRSRDKEVTTARRAQPTDSTGWIVRDARVH